MDSVGVATHLRYKDTPYARFDLVQERLLELGVRHIRDGWPADDPRLAAKARTLAADGIMTTFVHDPREGGTPAEQHAEVADRMAGAVVAAESLNEWDARDGDWAQEAVAWTLELVEAYNSDPRTEDIPVLAPSLSQVNDEQAHRALAPLRGLVDQGNVHDYPGRDLIMNDRILDTVFEHQQLVVGDAPVVATETGYSDGPVDAPYEVMSEDVIASLLPRLFLEHFRRGVVRTFAYELIDEGPGPEFEDSFGLVSFDGTPKPSYRSLQSLLSVLSVESGRCDQPELVWTLQGGDRTVRSLLLRGGEDQYFLALWRQVQLWDDGGPSENEPLPVQVEIANSVGDVRQFVPGDGTDAVSESTGGSIGVDLSGRVTVIELNDVEPAAEPSPTPE